MFFYGTTSPLFSFFLGNWRGQGRPGRVINCNYDCFPTWTLWIYDGKPGMQINLLLANIPDTSIFTGIPGGLLFSKQRGGRSEFIACYLIKWVISAIYYPRFAQLFISKIPEDWNIRSVIPRSGRLIGEVSWKMSLKHQRRVYLNCSYVATKEYLSLSTTISHSVVGVSAYFTLKTLHCETDCVLLLLLIVITHRHNHRSTSSECVMRLFLYRVFGEKGFPLKYRLCVKKRGWKTTFNPLK